MVVSLHSLLRKTLPDKHWNKRSFTCWDEINKKERTGKYRAS